jgi:hypothetical protein
MNLNKNLRTEQFDIDVGSAIGEFYIEWFDALWDESGRTRDNQAIIKAVFDRFLALPPIQARPPTADRFTADFDDLGSLSLDPFFMDDDGVPGT